MSREANSAVARPTAPTLPWRRVIATVCLATAAICVAAPVASAGSSRAGVAGTKTVANASNSSLVTIVHGLRGQLVDVYLDGTKLLSAFAPDRITDALAVPAGPHHVDLRPAGSAADSTPKASADITVPPGKSLSVVAHFDATGGWTMTVYANDVSRLAPGQARVVFRNASSVAPVNVQLNGAPTATLAAAAEATQVLTAATYSVQVQSGTDSSTLVPANSVPVADGSDTLLYLVGQGHDVIWLTQKIGGLDTAPAAISTGNSGLVDSSGDRSGPLLIAGALGIAAVLAGGSLLRRRRQPV